MTRFNMKWVSFLRTIAIVLFLSNCGDKSSDKQTGKQLQENTMATSTGNKRIIINLLAIRQKTLPEIERVLGKPQSIEQIKGYPCKNSKCEKAIFDSGKIEIIFKNDRSDRITVLSTPNLTNMDDAIQTLGLPAIKPSFKNDNVVIRWSNVESIHEISFFPDYILIQISKPD